MKASTLLAAIACASGIFVSTMGPAIAQNRTAWLKDNETTTMTGYLLQGEDISALCDEDCNDINLFLFNEMGVMVDSDNQIDATPIVTAPYEGTFVVEVSMPSCVHGAGCSVSLSSDHGF
ncbi:MAG: hypothetical protein AAF171_16930 [Cyanobacteria bacterium P01_A01_bin.116]